MITSEWVIEFELIHIMTWQIQITEVIYWTTTLEREIEINS
jgi:hypothetical protein